MPDAPAPRPDDRLRDALTAHGPMPPAELAAASGVPVREVLRSLAGGALQPRPSRTEQPCSVCREPAAVNGLCDGCRGALVAGTRPPAAADRERPAGRAAGAFRSRRRGGATAPM